MDKQQFFLSINSDDYEQRIEAIVAAYEFIDDPQVAEKVIDKINDDDFLVRVNAIEAIGDCNLQVSDSILLRLLHDKEKLVTCATLTTIGLLNKKELVSEVEDILLNTKGIEQVDACYCLYLLGYDEYLLKALGYLDDPDYLVRIKVINLAYNFLRDSDLDRVISQFKEKVKNEETVAVRSALQRFLDAYVPTNEA